MPFNKGRKRTGGRVKGTPNALTVLRRAGIAEVAAELNDAGIDIIKRIAAILPELEPHQEAAILVSLMPYRYPKLKPKDMKHENPFEKLTKQEKIKALNELIEALERADAIESQVIQKNE